MDDALTNQIAETIAEMMLQEKIIRELLGKIQWLLDTGLVRSGEDGCFTFPDGDTWSKTQDKILIAEHKG